MCKGMVDQGFSCDPKNTKATETRKTVEPIFQGGGGQERSRWSFSGMENEKAEQSRNSALVQ